MIALFSSRQLYLTALLFVLAMPAITSADSAVALDDYPQARKMFSSSLKEKDYLLALGSYKKVAGVWRIDHQERITGDVERYTFELPADVSAKAGFDHYVKQLNTKGANTLFTCGGRDCGTSNSWANNHFKILQLYGLDQYQYYGAFVIPREATTYAAIYAVKRGNNRVHVQVDLVRSTKNLEISDQSAVAQVFHEINEKGFYSIVAPSDTEVAVLSDVLTTHPELHVAIVGHDYSEASVVEQKRLSLSNASQIKQLLIEKGVSASRVDAYGLGGLSLKGRQSETTRIDIVKVTRHR
jgi:hypothetical protein